MESFTIFDLMTDEEAIKYKPIKSTDWKWTMAEGYPKEKNGLKVFSFFACGGGSTMGYKLAGCEVIGCREIDPKMNEVYIKNHHPKHNFCMDIRDFNKLDNLPEELYNLDILDGSPPCTTFSMAGEREESWGKKKKFREGQAEQTLDDLSFYPPWHCFTAMICEKCGEMYEADREHICRKKNSYPIREQKKGNKNGKAN